jgi:alkanesulfonate monooxygenase SsuD/methylene tetrahydromethanopterin reductase-like flavin-dependent oxidoreductase (luciferase family)
MKWGIFTLSQIPDQARRIEAFDEDMRQFKLAEDLGYDTIWIAEHLFSTYCVVNSAQVLAAAIAATTRRIRIGTAVVVVPFAHPLRTAGDFALVDILSHGRLLFGVGRAYNPAEFAGLNLPIEKSRAMFIEGMDIIVRAWKEPSIKYDGEFWTIPRETDVLPKPVQQPHPPIYSAATSAETFELVAERGWNLEIASTFSYRFFREEWLERLQGLLANYEADCLRYGRQPKAAERMMMIPFFVAPKTAEAIDVHGKYFDWFLGKLKEVSGSAVDKPAIIKGYELSSTEGPKTVAMGYQNYKTMHRHGAAIAGDPDTCIARLKRLKEQLGITEFCLWFNMGGIPPDCVRRSMRMAMEKVLPYV